MEGPRQFCLSCSGGVSSSELTLIWTQTKPGGDPDKARMERGLGNSEETRDPWERSE